MTTNIVNTEDQANKTPKPRGRPLAFDQDKALDQALHLFWTHGYEGTSMAELTEALGINKPSIYAAFGNKETLFRKALAKYLEGPAAYVAAALQEPTAKKVATTLLNNAVEVMTNPASPGGCMVVQSALTCGQGAGLIQQELAGYRQHFEAALAKRFEQAKTEEDLPRDANTLALAKYLATLHQGLSVQATSGASREALQIVINMALKHWPH
jgi:AcrR family transcriptional regulator